VREEVRRFCDQLIELFGREPHARPRSPNNIFVVEEGAECRCLLVDTGPPDARLFELQLRGLLGVVVPQKIARYKAVGYI